MNVDGEWLGSWEPLLHLGMILHSMALATSFGTDGGMRSRVRSAKLIGQAAIGIGVATRYTVSI